MQQAESIHHSDRVTLCFTDHITTAVPSPLIGPNIEELGTRFPDMSEVYSKKLQDIIRKSAKDCGIPLQEGVYVQLTGQTMRHRQRSAWSEAGAQMQSV